MAKERLSHEEKLHEETKVKNAELQCQVDQLTKEVVRLKQELSKVRVLDQFVERDGMLWKKTCKGPFCITCKGTVSQKIRNIVARGAATWCESIP